MSQSGCPRWVSFRIARLRIAQNSSWGDRRRTSIPISPELSALPDRACLLRLHPSHPSSWDHQETIDMAMTASISLLQAQDSQSRRISPQTYKTTLEWTVEQRPTECNSPGRGEQGERSAPMWTTLQLRPKWVPKGPSGSHCPFLLTPLFFTSPAPFPECHPRHPRGDRGK